MGLHAATMTVMRRALPVLLCVLGLFVVACEDTPSEGPRDELLVSAAASLTDAFGEIELRFEHANPDVDVVLNLGGSSALREQILEGAPSDVFASANQSNMDRLMEAGALAGDPEVFARNMLQIAVPVGNPGEVVDLEDFERPELLIGLCAKGVPCGELAREALARAGVTPSIDTNEPDVRALLTKIELGELDAGITYVTDVAGADGSVEGVDIPESENVFADYSIAVVSDAPSPHAASRFVAFVLSDEGREILTDYGFGSP